MQVECLLGGIQRTAGRSLIELTSDKFRHPRERLTSQWEKNMVSPSCGELSYAVGRFHPTRPGGDPHPVGVIRRHVVARRSRYELGLIARSRRADLMGRVQGSRYIAK